MLRLSPLEILADLCHTDGEWQQTIIDDKLYLAHPDYDDSSDARFEWNYINRKDAEAEYRKAYQTGSRALFFSKCDDEK